MTARNEIREELWNALSHGLGALLAVVGASVLVTLAALRHVPVALATACVYGGSLVLLYTASTLYHAIPHPRAKGWLQVLDHCAIYVLIAGTYTPFALLGLRGTAGTVLLVAIWALAAVGVGFKLGYAGRLRGLSTAIYLAMGWLGVLAGRRLFDALSGPTLAWLLAGGLAYSLGTVAYLSRRAYAHAVWHAFVLAGSGCHFVAITGLVLGAAR